MTAKDLLISYLILFAIMFSVVAVAYGAATDLAYWSATTGVQEDITLTITEEGALNLREMEASGGAVYAER